MLFLNLGSLKKEIMLLERVNLHLRLKKLRNKEISEEKLLREVQKILQAEEETEQEILRRLQDGAPSDHEGNSLDIDLLESDRIFHISQIKELCITYRLRFLS